MIINVGTDILEISRINKIIGRKKSFIYRVFTQNEIEYLKSKSNIYESAAGLFCAKEAVSKALGTGIRGFSFKDIEIIRDSYGKPAVKLYNGADRVKKRLGIDNIFLSISHSKNNAIAFVIVESDK